MVRHEPRVLHTCKPDGENACDQKWDHHTSHMNPGVSRTCNSKLDDGDNASDQKGNHLDHVEHEENTKDNS